MAQIPTGCTINRATGAMTMHTRPATEQEYDAFVMRMIALGSRISASEDTTTVEKGGMQHDPTADP